MNKSRCFLVDMYLCGHQLVGYIIYINIKSNNSTVTLIYIFSRFNIDFSQKWCEKIGHKVKVGLFAVKFTNLY